MYVPWWSMMHVHIYHILMLAIPVSLRFLMQALGKFGIWVRNSDHKINPVWTRGCFISFIVPSSPDRRRPEVWHSWCHSWFWMARQGDDKMSRVTTDKSWFKKENGRGILQWLCIYTLSEIVSCHGIVPFTVFVSNAFLLGKQMKFALHFFYLFLRRMDDCIVFISLPNDGIRQMSSLASSRRLSFDSFGVLGTCTL